MHKPGLEGRAAKAPVPAGGDLGWVALGGFARTLGVGMTGVLLLVTLTQAGQGPGDAFLVLAGGLLGSAAGLALVTRYGDRWGRRRLLAALGLAQALGGLGLALFAPQVGPALACAFLGMVNGMGRDRGPALALEQALLPATTDDRGRTRQFARYHVVLDLGHGLGALLALLPGLLGSLAGLAHDAWPQRLTLALLFPLGLLSLTAALRLSAQAEVGTAAQPPPLTPTSRRLIARLAGLFALDSLGGGFLPNALLALWFFERFQLDPAAVGLLFGVGRAANALSYLLAARLAARIGLVRTMVGTHVPSSLILLALPWVGSMPAAVALYLLRELLVEMDLPTRQSYTMAVVAPAERTRAAAITGLARALAWATGALIASRLVPRLGLTAPLMLGAGLKIAYDLLLYRAMVGTRPPEERPAGESSAAN